LIFKTSGMPMSLRIIFMGTPEFSVPTLRALVDAGHKIVAVYTQPPRPGGRRGLDLQKSPVHQAAELLGFPVFTPINFKDPDEREKFAAHEADVAVVVAYGLLLPQTILDGTRLGCYNGHASLLPRWRGAAPIQRAIMAGDAETGMMVMKMEKGLDTGPVALTRNVAIGATTTAGELHDQLMLAGAKAMAEAMNKLEMHELPLTPQAEEGVLYASKIDKGETRIDFSRPATEVDNHIRGLSPFPGAWFEADLNGKPERIKVLGSALGEGEGEGEAGTVIDADNLTIACGTGAVRLTRLQKAGGKPMAATEFLRGTPLVPGTRLG
jgi:methionyl-tRNA formyltransferase